MEGASEIMLDLNHIVRQTEAIEGWFQPLDVAVFAAVGRSQTACGMVGNLLEIGAYFGKSAVVLGHMAAGPEDVVVCDVFEDCVADSAAQAEWTHHYRGLTQSRFEANYRAVHAGVPTVLRVPSEQLGMHLPGESFRFVHVDGGHLYAQVAADVEVVLRLAQPGAVISFDDISRPASPGVAAAVWPQVIGGPLVPMIATPNKLYVSVGPAPELAALVLSELQHLAGIAVETQAIELTELAVLSVPRGRDLITGRVDLARRVRRRTAKGIARLRRAMPLAGR